MMFVLPAVTMGGLHHYPFNFTWMDVVMIFKGFIQVTVMLVVVIAICALINKVKSALGGNQK